MDWMIDTLSIGGIEKIKYSHHVASDRGINRNKKVNALLTSGLWDDLLVAVKLSENRQGL